MLQLQENKQQKEKILSNIDYLSTKLTKNHSQRHCNEKKDIAVFECFLNSQTSHQENKINTNWEDYQGHDSTSANNIPESYSNDATRNGNDNLKTLLHQNKLLSDILEQKRKTTSKSIINLQYHENILSHVTTLLRNDSNKYEIETINETRKNVFDSLFPCEDKEFEIYIANINNMKSIYDLNAIYKVLLQLLDSMKKDEI